MVSDMKSLRILAISGFISLLIAVGSGLLLDFFRSESFNLQYTINSAEIFPGEQTTGIVSIDIANVGRREVDDVFCRITVPGVRIREQRIVGLFGGDEIISTTENSVEVRFPFLNPNDEFSVHLLLDSFSQILPLEPVVELRGRGVIGSQEVPPQGGQTDLLRNVLTALAGIVAFVLSAQVVLSRGGLPGLTSGHFDDQRDIVAYVLSGHGFLVEAEDLRHTGRRLSYWSIVDELTDKWLNIGDNEMLARGVAVLDHLLEYATIRESSKHLIRFNIARLALQSDDTVRLRKEIRNLNAKKSSIVAKRLDHNEALRKKFESFQ